MSVSSFAVEVHRLIRRLFGMLTALGMILASSGCASPTDCAYYGAPSADARCVVVGPAPTGAGP